MKKGRKTPKSDSSSKPKKLIDEDSWRAPLEEISINDDHWRCIVIMMVETITEHSSCVSLFNAAAEEGRRKSIYSLSCQKTLASMKALSKHSLDKCPTIQGVCHYASKVFNADNDMLPTWLMALVIKFLIYRAREESIGIVKRLADLEHEIEEEYWIMQTVAGWGRWICACMYRFCRYRVWNKIANNVGTEEKGQASGIEPKIEALIGAYHQKISGWIPDACPSLFLKKCFFY